MASNNINNTIKAYRELQAQIKQVAENQKILNQELKNTPAGNQYGKLKKELQELEVEFNDLQKQVEDTASSLVKDMGDGFAVVFEGAQPLTTQLSDLEDAMYALAIAGKQDTEAFKEMQEEAIRMRTTIMEVDAAVDRFADNAGIGKNIGEQFAALGSSLLSLDFNTAAMQAQSLANNMNKISWGTAINGIKNLTTAFSSLGKAILTNPVFLIATIIIGIGAAIYKLMKETGLLQVAMEALGEVFEWLMKPIRFLIDGLKKLTDAFGLTNNAQKEMADEAVKSANKAKNAYESYYNQMEYATDKYVKDKQDELDAIEDGEENALDRRLALQKQINDAMAEQAQRTYNTVNNEANVAKANLDKFYADNGKNVKKYTEEQNNDLLALQKDYEAKRLDLRKAYEYSSTDVYKQGERAIKAIMKESTEFEKQQYAERLAKNKEYNDNRLKAQRAIRDAEISLMKDGIDKDLEERKEAYTRYLEDIKRDTTLKVEERNQLEKLAEMQYKKDIFNIRKSYWDETQKLIDKNNEEALKKAQEAAKKEEDIRKKAINALANHERRIRDLNATEQERAENAIRDYYEDLWEETKGLYKNTEDLIAAYLKLQRDMQAELEKIKPTFFEENEKRIAGLVGALKSAGGEYASLFGNIAEIAATGFGELSAILDDTEMKTTDKVAGIASTIGSMISGIFQAISQATNEALERDLDALDINMQEKFDNLDNMLLNQVISQEEYNKEKQKLEVEQNKEENKLRKQAFEENKQSQIASATMQMLTGAVSAFAGAMQLGPIAGPIVGAVLAAAVLGMGSKNIERIKATQYKATNTGALGGGSGDITIPDTSSNNNQPNFTFQGNGNNANTSTTGGIGKVVVSVTDIQDALVEVSTTDTYNTLGGGSEDGPG